MAYPLAVIFAGPPFYYLEPAYGDAAALLILVIFQLLNRAYLTGFFFLPSRYITPGSFNHKGSWRWVQHLSSSGWRSAENRTFWTVPTGSRRYTPCGIRPSRSGYAWG